MKTIVNLLASSLVILPLVGCTGNVPTPDFSTIIATVINDCSIGCSFVPDAEAIAAILLANDPLFNTATSIANYICQKIQSGASVAMDRKTTRLLSRNGAHKMSHALLVRGQPIVIDGVVVTGHFIIAKGR